MTNFQEIPENFSRDFSEITGIWNHWTISTACDKWHWNYSNLQNSAEISRSGNFLYVDHKQRHDYNGMIFHCLQIYIFVTDSFNIFRVITFLPRDVEFVVKFTFLPLLVALIVQYLVLFTNFIFCHTSMNTFFTDLHFYRWLFHCLPHDV